MKPKCFSEAGLPPLICASNSVRAFRNDAGEVETIAEFLVAQSLFSCIAGFLRNRGIAQAPCWSKILVTCNNSPIVRLCGARPVLLLPSKFRNRASVPGFYLHIRACNNATHNRILHTTISFKSVTNRKLLLDTLVDSLHV